MRRRLLSCGPFTLVTLVLLVALHPPSLRQSDEQGACQTFSETNKTVCGRFLKYWQDHGGLTQQKSPLVTRLANRAKHDLFSQRKRKTMPGTLVQGTHNTSCHSSNRRS